MKTRFYILLSVIVSLLASFAGKGGYDKTATVFNDHTTNFSNYSPVSNHTNITDLDKRPNSDRLRIRTKANVDNWEISLPVAWHYIPTLFFIYTEQRHYAQQSAVYANYLLSATLRGPPFA